jgi:hypothetical protein
MKLASLTNLAAGLVIAAALSANLAKADQITGTIDFDSLATVTSTTVTPTGTPGILSASGSFAGLSGAITLFPVEYNPATNGELWSIGTSDSFDITSFTTSITDVPGFIDLGGSGTITLGSETQTGTWSLSGSTTGGPQSFQFGETTTPVATPDSGTTALLIGLGLAGVGFGATFQRRKLVKA